MEALDPIESMTQRELVGEFGRLYRANHSHEPDSWLWTKVKRNKTNAKREIQREREFGVWYAKVQANGGKVVLPHFAELLGRFGL